jgi:hypothetical protein
LPSLQSISTLLLTSLNAKFGNLLFRITILFLCSADVYFIKLKSRLKAIFPSYYLYGIGVYDVIAA